MAQKLRNIMLGAPGFYGLNTELSPVELPPQFATTADNCVIDEYGRLGARKGFLTASSSNTALGGNKVKRIFEWNSSGTSVLFAVGNNKIFRLDTTTNAYDTFTEMDLPVGYTITGDDWDFADWNGEGYFFQAGHEPLLVNTTLNATDDLDTLDNQSTETSPAAPEGNIILATMSRLWASGVSTAPEMVYWSDTLIGDGWTEGAKGSLDMATVWPNGYDEVQALGYQNNRLVIFGKNSIVIYSGADDPTTMVVEDTIEGTGCVARDSVVNTGDDILYLSSTGVRSLGRTIQESSLPLGDISQNIRTELIGAVTGESTGINAVYSPEESFYLLTLEGAAITYVFDFRGALENGARRVTEWPTTPFNCFMRSDAGTLFVGGSAGVGTYSGYQDDGSSYRYQYYGPTLTFDVPANLKFLKKVRPVLIGANNQEATISWGYGYDGTWYTDTVTIVGGTPAEYGVGEYNIAEYSTSINVSDQGANTDGSGEEVRLGVGADIDGEKFSLQRVGVYALIGRLV